MTSRTSGHRPRTVLATLTVAIAVGVSGVVAGPASAAPASASASAPVEAGHTLVPLKSAPKPGFKPNTASPTQGSGNCDTVRAGLKQDAVRHAAYASHTSHTTATTVRNIPTSVGAPYVTLARWQSGGIANITLPPGYVVSYLHLEYLSASTPIVGTTCIPEA